MSSADTKLLFCNLEKKWIINQYSNWMYRKSSSVAIKLYFQPKWNIITITFTRHHYCPFNTTAHRNWFSVHFICHIFICNELFHSHLFRRKFSQSKNSEWVIAPFILLLLRMNPMIFVLPVPVLFLLTLYRIRTLRLTLSIVPGVDPGVDLLPI